MAVPERRGLHDLDELEADRVDRGGEVDIEQHRADQISRLPGPILERFFDEITQRHDQAAQIPQADHDIGRGDLLDSTRLVLDDDMVVDADRLGGCDLDAGDKIAQDRSSREARH
jgi:hypothetical protein